MYVCVYMWFAFVSRVSGVRVCSWVYGVLLYVFDMLCACFWLCVWCVCPYCICVFLWTFVDNSNRRTFRFLVFPMWTNSSGTLKEKSFWWFVICLERSEWSTEWRNWMSKRWKVEVRAQREVRQGMVGERDSKIAMQFMWLLREKFKGKWGGGWFVVRLYRVTE